MRKGFILFFTGLIWSLAIQAQEPQNIDCLKKEIMSYYCSGEYFSDINSVVFAAKNCIAQRIAKAKQCRCPQKLAIVLDVDETSLLTYKTILGHHFATPSIGLLEHEFQHLEGKAIPCIRDLFNFAHCNHIAVFFITGRHPTLKVATIQNLHIAGYSGWQGLYFKPDRRMSASCFKRAIRQMITEKGYCIIANIGDQYSDIEGGFAEANFKLPNPFYYVK